MILAISFHNRKRFASVAFVTLVLIVAELLALVWPIPVQAAGNGNIGVFSSGNVGINIRKQSSIQAVAPSDMIIHSWGEGVSKMVWVGDVYINTALSGGYEVTATGGGFQGEFVLSSGEYQIPIKVGWSDSKTPLNMSRVVSLEPGIPKMFDAKSRLERTCTKCRKASLCNHAYLIVSIPNIAYPYLRTGRFSQSLTLVIATN